VYVVQGGSKVSKHVEEQIRSAFEKARSQPVDLHMPAKPEPPKPVGMLQSVVSIEKDVNNTEKQKRRFEYRYKTLLRAAMGDPVIKQAAYCRVLAHRQDCWDLTQPIAETAEQLIEQALKLQEPKLELKKESLLNKKIF
jgi:hypothetical protein